MGFNLGFLKHQGFQVLVRQGLLQHQGFQVGLNLTTPRISRGCPPGTNNGKDLGEHLPGTSDIKNLGKYLPGTSNARDLGE